MTPRELTVLGHQLVCVKMAKRAYGLDPDHRS